MDTLCGASQHNINRSAVFCMFSLCTFLGFIALCLNDVLYGCIFYVFANKGCCPYALLYDFARLPLLDLTRWQIICHTCDCLVILTK